MSKKAMYKTDARHIDFGILMGTVGSNSTTIPSDIDMILERNGKFLVGEWKYYDMRKCETISIGQEIMLKRLAGVDGFTVLRVYYKYDADDLPIVGRFSKLTPHGEFIDIGTGLDDFKKYIDTWWRLAND